MVISTMWFECEYLGNGFPFVWFYTVQVGLVVKGRNKKEVLLMKSPIICNCLDPRERGCLRVMQFTSKMVW